MTYMISPDGKAITCRRCGLTSHNPRDVAELYCGNCHQLHDEHVRAFDCSECGRHIISICGPRPALDGSDRCAACMSMPGWFLDPELRRVLDPDGLVRKTLQ